MNNIVEYKEKKPFTINTVVNIITILAGLATILNATITVLTFIS